jgi:hypothetical protein
MPRRARARVATAALSVAIVAAGFAMSRPAGSSGADAQPPASARGIARATSEHFAAFRRAAGRGDTPPLPALGVLGAEHPGLSRLVASTGDGAVYLVARADELCLVTTRPGMGSSAGCTSASSAASVGLTESQAARPGSTDRLVRGAAPDGTRSVRFRTESGRTIEAPVRGNGFAAVVPADSSEVGYVGLATRVPIVRPPAE